MGILKRPTPWEQEFRAVWRQEQKFLRRYETPSVSPLDRKLEELAPEALMETLHGAFAKAFGLVFEKGTGVIQWAGRDRERQRTCQVNQYAADLREDRTTLRAFSKAANAAGRRNVLISGAAGVGMGLLGIALPDVPLFTGMLLKSVYETAASYGFAYDTPEEKLLILRLIQTALSYGTELRDQGRALDGWFQTATWPDEADMEKQLQATARRVSEAVVYGKFLQNIPVAGAVGGAGDAVCLRRVQQYAAIKYRKRFLIQRRNENG